MLRLKFCNNINVLDLHYILKAKMATGTLVAEPKCESTNNLARLAKFIWNKLHVWN